MKDATVGALSRVPAQVLPAVPMATPVDPIFTAIERDRIAYVAFAASLNKTDGRKAAQEKGREVTQTDEDAHEAASGVGDDAVSAPGCWVIRAMLHASRTVHRVRVEFPRVAAAPLAVRRIVYTSASQAVFKNEVAGEDPR